MKRILRRHRSRASKPGKLRRARTSAPTRASIYISRDGRGRIIASR